jgi:aldose 1-epimerase
MNEGTIYREPFGCLASGEEVTLCTLRAENGLCVSITNYGGAITSAWTPDRDGVLGDVVLGYDTLDEYLSGRSYFGAAIGRFGNRLNRGKFTLDGTEYSLAVNDGRHHLHGGPGGFDKVLWQIAPTRSDEDARLTLTYFSRNGEEGYPGNLQVAVTYSLPTPNTLEIHYRAETDKPTPINLTNHSYFNLAGHSATDILGHELMLFAELFTPVDAGLIPTGEMQEVARTPFDFRHPRRIGDRINANDEQIRYARGYDHNFVIVHQGGGLQNAARVRDPGSGRTLEVLTSEPGCQFYSGNFLDGSEKGKGGASCQYRAGFCLETQHFPDSPNHPHFPSTILRPGEVFESTTLYRFTVS